jgi:hypothetical protein
MCYSRQKHPGAAQISFRHTRAGAAQALVDRCAQVCCNKTHVQVQHRVGTGSCECTCRHVQEKHNSRQVQHMLLV